MAALYFVYSITAFKAEIYNVCLLHDFLLYNLTSLTYVRDSLIHSSAACLSTLHALLAHHQLLFFVLYALSVLL